MIYDFDTVIDRRGTQSVKWDLADTLFKGEDLLPMWVADMDFLSPPEVIDALEERARHGIFGYTAAMGNYQNAVISWFSRRHGWDISPEWISFGPGVIPALDLLINAFSKPGEGVLIQKPVYYPFMSSIKLNERKIVNNPLIFEKGYYQIDFADLDKKASDKNTTLMILCNPHNPVGRVYKKEELLEIGRICMKHDVLVIADEIHCDLIYPGFRHIPYGTLGSDYQNKSIICTSPSKTFNLAGLHTANIIIENQALRNTYQKKLNQAGILGPTVFGSTACQAAYNSGEPWLQSLITYLQGNLDFLRNFLQENIPSLSLVEPEGTYLVWLNFKNLQLDTNSLKELMIKKAKVAPDHGFIFGSPEGDGFERLNIACPRSLLNDGLQRIAEAIGTLPTSD